MSPSPSCTTAIEFTLQNTLRCHTKAINHLALSPDKTRLISIGDDSRVVVWSVASGERLFAVERPFNGAATAVSWTSRDNSRFVVGYASGDLHLFRNESEKSYCDSLGVSGGKGSVEGIVYDETHDRIASICADSAMLWKIKGADLVPILSSPFISGGYGRCIQFCDNGASVVIPLGEEVVEKAEHLDLQTAAMRVTVLPARCGTRLGSQLSNTENAEVCKLGTNATKGKGQQLHDEKEEERAERDNAAPNHDGKLLLVSNLKGGIDKYQFPSMERVQTFTFPTEINCILQTKSLPQGNLIVIGGDDGFAWVFNRISGQLVSEIHHGVHGQLVQVVEAFVDPGDRCIVVTATSGKAPYELKIWHYQPQKYS
ncbi:WD40-repeat-containing domain protein [Lactarius hatsudake]|nr:WD40-repeat-containing domain protein [Lactarius hatsudake]